MDSLTPTLLSPFVLSVAKRRRRKRSETHPCPLSRLIGVFSKTVVPIRLVQVVPVNENRQAGSMIRRAQSTT